MSTYRSTPLEIGREEFRRVGHELIDALSDLMATMRDRPVTSGETHDQIRHALGDAPLPEGGSPVGELMPATVRLLLDHSLFNGHPRFLGYITSSPAPIGALADLLAAAVNQNVGADILSPMATAIEKQTIGWLSEFIGVAPGYGGLMVSGGNMANFTAFLAARTAIAPPTLREQGLVHMPEEMVMYCSKTTHTWIEKAAILFGHGTQSIRWIPTDEDLKMDNTILARTIGEDLEAGRKPFLVVGTAGDVSTGIVDDLAGIATICKKYGLWFHIDGAYGIPAAVLPECKEMFAGMREADSIAFDPHKWLYAPLEAGCILVKDPTHLLNTYSTHPAYYHFAEGGKEPPLNYYEYGFQNSRGFRALKVWLALQQVGKKGYMGMIREDIAIAAHLFQEAGDHPELETLTQHLSISTFRYVPLNLKGTAEEREAYLNMLNEKLLDDIQRGGELFLSNAVVAGKYCLRACVVNFRTTKRDMEEIARIIVRQGRIMHEQLHQEWALLK
jgi:aromatic-L-amino-acid decarboxylase